MHGRRFGAQPNAWLTPAVSEAIDRRAHRGDDRHDAVRLAVMVRPHTYRLTGASEERGDGWRRSVHGWISRPETEPEMRPADGKYDERNTILGL